MRIAAAFLAAFVCFGVSAPALASLDDDITEFDQSRLAHFADAKRQGLSEAGSDAFVSSVVSPEGGQVAQNELVGSWRCRIVKLGGYTPIKSYDWFRCVVRTNGNGLFFEKVTGSERLSGYLDPYQGKYVLLAAMTVGDETPKPYSGGNPGIGAPVKIGRAHV